jgi:hypothetical protein
MWFRRNSVVFVAHLFLPEAAVISALYVPAYDTTKSSFLAVGWVELIVRVMENIFICF